MFSKFKSLILTFLKGGAIGIANIIPGLSGGTIAVVTGIYEKLLESISDIFSRKNFGKEPFFFLIVLFTGTLTFIFLSANFITFLLDNYFEPFMFFLIGIILGSIPGIIKLHSDMKINFYRIIILLVGISIPISLAKFTNVASHEPLVKELGYQSIKNIYNYIVLSFTGVLAGGSMILPGISGSLIMVILGQYDVVVYSLKNLLFTPLIYLTAGIILGIVVFAKLIRLFLNKFRAFTLYFIIGLLLGSCYKIYPGLPNKDNLFFFSVFIFIIGSIISFLLSQMKAKVMERK